MMRERNSDPSECVRVDVEVLIYLRHREDPISQIVTYEFDPGHLGEGTEVADFMEIATRFMLATIDTVAEHRLLLGNERFDKSIYLTSEIQGITLLAPSQESLVAILEENK